MILLLIKLAAAFVTSWVVILFGREDVIVVTTVFYDSGKKLITKLIF